MIRELAVKSNSSHPTALDRFKQFGKQKQLYKRVPHELRENEKDRRYEVCSELLFATRAIHSSIGTYDKKWILYYNRQCSAQWLHRGKPTQRQRCTKGRLWWWFGRGRLV
ncbi:hypothetical protein AVEN_65303-1 [Araneus ventricosus]|uniref:Mos1 transposase HTH domain-containing protein n=1 Tax=Araneus ventricosus TaxID=182803 RepID=A0A4Y2AHP0_ARAVE|nr:hypothetical protein AVEN_65303-1 [Araneus ventricosus]